METITNLVLMAGAILAGTVLVAVGVFSVLSLLWDDLLESDRRDRDGGGLPRPA